MSRSLLKNVLKIISICEKVANYLKDVLEDQRDKLAENLLANNGMHAQIDWIIN